jgi:ribose-phosphate pyrophosphokinase
VKLSQFANGEIYVRYLESVRGADVFIIQSVCSPVNETLILLIMVDARASARHHGGDRHYGYAAKTSVGGRAHHAKLVADASAAHRPRHHDTCTKARFRLFNQPVNHLTALPIRGLFRVAPS